MESRKIMTLADIIAPRTVEDFYARLGKKENDKSEEIEVEIEEEIEEEIDEEIEMEALEPLEKENLEISEEYEISQDNANSKGTQTQGFMTPFGVWSDKNIEDIAYLSDDEENSEYDDDDDDDQPEDETLAERLWGLAEMFPETVRTAAWTISTSSMSCFKGLRRAVWIATTSAAILALPALIAREKFNLEEFSRQQQRQILLGPGAG